MEESANSSHLIKNSNIDLDVVKNIQDIFQKGDRYYEEGRYHESIRAYKELLSVPEKDNESFCAEVYEKIGIALLKAADYTAAYDYLSKALERKENFDPSDSLGIHKLKIAIGQVCLGEAKLSEALDHFRSSLEALVKLHGEENQEVKICYNNIAEVFIMQGKYFEALEYTDKVIQNCNDSHKSEVATAYFLKSVAYRYLSEFGNALVNAEKSLKMREELHGEYHPKIADSLHILARIYQDQCKYAKALENYQNALKMRLDFLKELHPSVGDSYNGIGMVYEMFGNYTLALKNYKESLRIYTSVSQFDIKVTFSI